jgi:hypothetical protein
METRGDPMNRRDAVLVLIALTAVAAQKAGVKILVAEASSPR